MLSLYKKENDNLRQQNSKLLKDIEELNEKISREKEEGNVKEIKKRMNDDLPILNVVKLNNIVDPEITKLLDEISDIEDKYNKLKDDYTQKYIKDNDEDNNNDLPNVVLYHTPLIRVDDLKKYNIFLFSVIW